MEKRIDTFSALKYSDFRYFLSVQFLYTAAVLIQEVVLGFYLYEITGDALALGVIGLLEAIPYLILALFGGHVADRLDKKKVARVAIFFMVLVSLFLTIGLSKTEGNITAKYIIYVAVFLIGICRGFLGPSWSSMKPFLVDKEHYVNAATWSSQFWQSGMLIGPIVSGFLYAYIGIQNTLIIVMIIFTICFFLISMIKANAKADYNPELNIWQSLSEGFSFVKRSKIIFYALGLDMFSVMFGGVVAILPVFAKDILHVGAEGLGIMRAAPGIGAVLTMLILAKYPPTEKAWANMLRAIAGFGVATLLFALSKDYIFSCFMLFLTGVFDSISVVIRQTILNLLPPEEMRGRVSSINGVFVSCSNELGAFESGVAAKLMGTVTSVVFGASMTLAIITIVYFKTKDLLAVNLLKMSQNQ
jgi:MFS family permease